MVGLQLAQAKGFIFDLDGCLILIERPDGTAIKALPGAAAVLERLRTLSLPFVCFTNGSSWTPEATCSLLESCGITVRPAEMLTPAVVAAEYIAVNFPGEQVLLLGSEAIRESLAKLGVGVVPVEGAAAAGVVMIGHHVDVTAGELEAACLAVDAGAACLVTNLANWVPVQGGKGLCLSTAIAGVISRINGVEPLLMGKPSQHAMAAACAHLGVGAQEVVVVGDDPGLDVRMGKDAGAYTVLVSSSVTGAGTPMHNVPAATADLNLRTVGELLSYIG